MLKLVDLYSLKLSDLYALKLFDLYSLKLSDLYSLRLSDLYSLKLSDLYSLRLVDALIDSLSFFALKEFEVLNDVERLMPVDIFWLSAVEATTLSLVDLDKLSLAAVLAS